MNESNAFLQILLPAVGILAFIAFAIFWLFVFYNIIRAFLQGVITFIAVLRRTPSAAHHVFLFIKTYPSVITISAVNIMPLVGVLWYGWEPFSVLFVYWMQTGIIGYFSYLKIKKVCEFEPAERRLKVIAFTVRHPRRAAPTREIIRDFVGVYIFGMAASIIFLIFYTGFAAKMVFDIDLFFRSFRVVGEAIQQSWGIILAGSFSFTASHASSYFFNFIGKKEYLHSSLEEQLSLPIERVGSIWAAVFIAMTALVFIPHLVTVLVALVIMKTILDVFAHLKEHGKVFPQLGGHVENHITEAAQ